MPLQAGTPVVAVVDGLGTLRGTVLRDAHDDVPGTPTAGVDGVPRVSVVQWTLEDGSVVTNTAAEAALRVAE